MDKCQKENFNGQCCCNCKHLLEDFYHCTTSPKPEGYDPKNHNCVCSTHKGWICHMPFEDGPSKAYSGWGEHGMCEMWTAKYAQVTEKKPWRGNEKKNQNC